MTRETQAEMGGRLPHETGVMESQMERMQSALTQIASLGDNAPDVSLGRRLGRIASDALAAANGAHDRG